jgi:CheY-like chemotaxis protein/chemotaxis protein CheY-P-specific phosphatase CheC
MSRLPRILVVDDDSDLLEVVGDAISTLQTDVTLVNDPVRALGFASFMKFDVIISDFAMPTLTGIQFASLMKQSNINSNVPLFVMSGQVGAPDVERLEKLGVIEVLQKPVPLDVLVKKIEALIRPPTRKILAYHPRIVSACTESLTEVLNFYLGEPAEKRKPSLKTDKKPPGLYSAMINLYGRRVYGSIGLGFDEGLMTALVKNLYGGEIPGQLRDHEGMVGEILNQVSGKIKSSLANLGLFVHIGLPEIIAADVQDMQPRVSGRILANPLSIAGGVASLEMCLGSGLNNERLAEDMNVEIFLSEVTE